MKVSPDPDVTLLAALADATRLEIVRQLGACDQACACDFVGCCDVSQPTISHHLKVLREAGIVVTEKRGTNIWYALDPAFKTRYAAIGATLAGLVAIS